MRLRLHCPARSLGSPDLTGEWLTEETWRPNFRKRPLVTRSRFLLIIQWENAMPDRANIEQLEAHLWDAADNLRGNSKHHRRRRRGGKPTRSGKHSLGRCSRNVVSEGVSRCHHQTRGRVQSRPQSVRVQTRH